MTPTDRRRRITDVFQLAVQMPAAERRRFVERECRGDDTLMRDVESLLSEYQSSYEKPGEVFSAHSETSPAPSVAGKFIGKYKVEEEIGSGGFGRVYSAHDPGFNRTVAIKVMSAPGDPDLVQRFLEDVPMKRFGEPEEIGELVLFMCSDACPFMTADTVYVNGGGGWR